MNNKIASKCAKKSTKIIFCHMSMPSESQERDVMYRISLLKIILYYSIEFSSLNFKLFVTFHILSKFFLNLFRILNILESN
jgi:hypothetical protein